LKENSCASQSILVTAGITDFTAASHTSLQSDVHDGSTRPPPPEPPESYLHTVVPGFQALILQTPLTHDGRLIIHGKKAEAGLQGGGIERLGDNAAWFAGQVVAAWVAVVPHNSLLLEEIVVVEAGKHYRKVEGAAGSAFVARALPPWAGNQAE